METKEIENKILFLMKELNDIKKVLCYEEKNKELKELNHLISSDGFWQNDSFQETMSKYTNLKSIIDVINKSDEELTILNEMIKISSEEEINTYIGSINEIEKEIESLKIKSMLSGEFDFNNAYIEVHSGAGGTESNDWANMVAKMYIRYFESNNLKYEIIDTQPGEEVGIKGMLIHVIGEYMYGYLKGETGVHRLVRISPFDANKRRHTSFASVLVTPEIDKSIEIDINENDLKIDVYHSGGAGGQSVNTTDSAVRITHLPTGLVVTCQNERSQIKNKEKAMEILKSRIYLLEKEKLNEKIKDLKGNVMDVNFGSAIRSYVMCPYTLVKDTRTNTETPNVDKVLNGEIKIFLESYMKMTD